MGITGSFLETSHFPCPSTKGRGKLSVSAVFTCPQISPTARHTMSSSSAQASQALPSLTSRSLCRSFDISRRTSPLSLPSSNAPLLGQTVSSASCFNRVALSRLRLLGLSACLEVEGIDAVSMHCYAALDSREIMRTPYLCGAQGRLFRRCYFIQNLRAYARAPSDSGVDLVETTATDLIEFPPTHQDCRLTHMSGRRGTGVICVDFVIITNG
jgi:hypothetical protein